MSFDPVTLINTILSFLSAVPAVGPYLAIGGKYAVTAIIASTAIVGVMHGLIGIATGLSAIPGCGWAKNIATALQKYDSEGEGFFNQYLMPLLNRLSAFKVPSAPAAAPAVVAPPAAPSA